MDKKDLNRRLTSLDSAFLYLEHDTVPMHIGGIDTFDGYLKVEDLQEQMASRLQYIPRYRQRLVTPPANLGHPTWEDDANFDIRNHVVEVKLPKPGTDAQFQRMCSKLFEGMLDREKPLWKVFVIQGLKDGKTGMLSLVHHCMVDGVSGAELLTILFDPTPNPKPVEPDAWEPRPTPERREILAEALWDNVGEQIANWTDMQKNLLDLARGAKGEMFMSILRELPGLSRDIAKPVRNLPFNVRKFTGKRKLAWSDVSFREARAIRSEVGGTVNDVVLTTLGGAMRRYLMEKDMRVDKQNLRVMIPVSLRKDDQRGAMGNLVSMLPIDIPLGEKDPVFRMQSITDRTSVLKSARAAEWLNLVMHMWHGITPALQAAVGQAIVNPQLQNIYQGILLSPGAHMVATNVPGPQIPLYVNGLRTERHIPLLPVVPGMGMNMGIFSYNHRLNFGLIADTAAAPDVDRFNDLLLESYVELRDSAGIEEVEPIEMRHTPLKPEAVEPRPKKTVKKKKAAAVANGNGASNGATKKPGPRKKPAKRVSKRATKKDE